MNHLANSAALIGLPEARQFQVFRPGIMLYGSYPSPRLRGLADLRPVMSLKAQVLQVKDLCAGDPVSYGRTYRCSGHEKMAVVGCGYSHGLPRSLSGKGTVLIRGRRAPICGRVCMHAFMARVDHIPGVAAQDEVVLMGGQGSEVLSPEEVAQAAGTISYEIFCSAGRLARREFIGASSDEAIPGKTAAKTAQTG